MTLVPFNAGSLKVQDIKPHVTEAEAEMIWSAAKTARTRLFIKALWYTGLRISEVLKLRARDLVFVGMDYNLSVTRAKKKKAKNEELPLPKNFGSELYNYIRDNKLDPANKLFPGHENAYRYQVRECAKRARLNNWQTIHPHMFRHGFVYHKAQQGIHPYVVSKLCGHSSLGITMAYYQPSQSDLREAMEK